MTHTHCGITVEIPASPPLVWSVTAWNAGQNGRRASRASDFFRLVRCKSAAMAGSTSGGGLTRADSSPQIAAGLLADHH